MVGTVEVPQLSSKPPRLKSRKRNRKQSSRVSGADETEAEPPEHVDPSCPSPTHSVASASQDGSIASTLSLPSTSRHPLEIDTANFQPGWDGDAPEQSRTSWNDLDNIPVSPYLPPRENSQVRMSTPGKRNDKLRSLLERIENNVELDPQAQLSFYKTGPILGQGAFGKVNLCWHRLSGERVAIKSYNRGALRDPNMRRSIKREITAMEACQRDGFVRLLESIHAKQGVHLVMEYVPRGSLAGMLRRAQTKDKEGGLGERLCWRVFRQVAAALTFMHRKNVAHRDMKMENVLLDLSGNVKLADFGFAAFAAGPKSLKEQCGTVSYMAPEIWHPNKDGYGRAVDLWSLGVMLFVMVQGTFPYRVVAQTAQSLYKFLERLRVQRPEKFPPAVFSLVEGMLTFDPTTRSTAEQIMLTEWVRSGPPPDSAVEGAHDVALAEIQPESESHVDLSAPFYGARAQALRKKQNAQDANHSVEVVQEMERIGFNADAIIGALGRKARNQIATTYHLLSERNKARENAQVRREKNSTSSYRLPLDEVPSELKDLGVTVFTMNADVHCDPIQVNDSEGPPVEALAEVDAQEPLRCVFAPAIDTKIGPDPWTKWMKGEEFLNLEAPPSPDKDDAFYSESPTKGASRRQIPTPLIPVQSFPLPPASPNRISAVLEEIPDAHRDLSSATGKRSPSRGKSRGGGARRQVPPPGKLTVRAPHAGKKQVDRARTPSSLKIPDIQRRQPSQGGRRPASRGESRGRNRTTTTDKTTFPRPERIGEAAKQQPGEAQPVVRSRVKQSLLNPALSPEEPASSSSALAPQGP